MMNSGFVIVLAGVLVAAYARPDGGLRGLQEFKTRQFCSSGASLSIRLTSGGSCSGVASASCSAYASSYGKFVQDIKEWVSNKNCQRKALVAQGEAHARAVAEVIVNAGVQVSCQGAGYACGYAFGKGSSLAKNIARVMAQAFVDADPRGVDQGTFCYADVEALGEVFAEVAETARADACARGYQSKEQWVSRYKKIVECAIAQAYVRAAAGFCSSKGNGDYESEKGWSRCAGSATVLWLCKGA